MTDHGANELASSVHPAAAGEVEAVTGAKLALWIRGNKGCQMLLRHKDANNLYLFIHLCFTDHNQ